uniref:11-beta-hydroxysteroid dehydrogenase 1B isoform X2 n=1 Tax=Elaeis guineensis var. tenera TaxID=51953 RepID=A0A6I9RP01_ELAGV|nr:11-beta-hydroxysteroid dehydrogenase 1B isoform X2 [Elaeis guineensis]
MDLITKFMNLFAPPTLLTALFFLLPPLYFFKLFLSFLSSLFPEDMLHKVVLITGASSGIGEQMAYQYAKKGACLVLVARRESSLLEVAKRAQELGSPDVLVLPADVAKPEECRRFIDATLSHFGRLDHLVNNAGIANLCMFEEAEDVTNFMPVLDVNFWGSIYPTYFALPHLKQTRGRIVVNSSSSGWLPMPRMSFYNASKAALINFFETLRIEFGHEIGITIATPGWIESEMTQGKFLSKEGRMVVDQELRDVLIGLVPVGDSEGCAKAIVTSACRGEPYVTEPWWFKVLYLWRVFVPEVMDWFIHMLYVTRPGTPSCDALSKKILDLSRAKSVIYPSSIQTSEIKKE